MKKRTHCLVGAFGFLISLSTPIQAGIEPQQVWVAAGGEARLELRADLLSDFGMVVLDDGRVVHVVVDTRRALGYGDHLALEAPYGNFERFLSGRLTLGTGWALRHQGREVRLDGLTLTPAIYHNGHPSLEARDRTGRHLLTFTHLHILADAKSELLTVHNADIVATPVLAERLGMEALADLPIGRAWLDLRLQVPAGADTSGGGPGCEDRPLWPQEGEPVDVGLIGMGTVAYQGTDPDTGGVKVAPSATLKNLSLGDVPWIPKFDELGPPFEYPYEPPDQHPFLVWNMYRIVDGRIEQLAASGVKHAFLTLNQNCDINCGSGNVLWPGCEDVYSSGTNDSNFNLGPRGDIEASLGLFFSTCSFFDPGCTGEQTNDSEEFENRLLVDPDELQTPGAAYFFDSWYVVQFDTDIWNSMGYHPITPTPQGGGWTFNPGPFAEGRAIDEWVDPDDPGPNAGHAAVVIPSATPDEPYPGNMPQGHINLLVRVTEPEPGVFRYNYAVQNFDFERGVEAFRIPLPAGAQVFETFFGDIDDDAANDWTVTVDGGFISFEGSADHPLPWFTLFNFEIEVDAPPAASQVTLALGGDAVFPSVDVDILGPAAGSAPVLTFAPASLDFGDVVVGTTSPPLTATLANSGDADATDLTFSGLPDAGFEADTTGCGTSLPAGASCEISVTFAPPAPGAAAATLQAASAEGATAELELAGNGVEDGDPFPEIELEEVVSGLTLPSAIAHAGDGGDRLFVAQQSGEIRIVSGGEILPTPFLDLSALVSCCGERGLLGLAFHPDYASNGFFYVDYTDVAGNTVVARYSVSAADPDTADPDSAQTVLTQAQPFSNHNGGNIAFGPDGYLYIAFGDGGGGGDPQDNGQDLETWLGKLLRVDVDGDDFPADPDRNYAVPPDNPFVGVDGLDEIWAYGLRNPWRFSFDRSTGDLWIGDVGQNIWEEIDLQPAASGGGENYGWDVLEGGLQPGTPGPDHPNCFEDDPGGDGACADFLSGGSDLPVIEYDHSLGCSVTGGYRYRGALEPPLTGVYFYADFCTGLVWGALPAGDGTWTSEVLLDTPFNITTFGEDEAGEVYVAEYASAEGQAKLHRIVAPGGAGGPIADISPDSFAFTLEEGEIGSDTLSIGNLGDLDLEWSITTDAPEAAQRVGALGHDPTLDEPFELPAFELDSLANGGEPVSFTVPGGVLTEGDVIGFHFIGTVSGINDTASWASDMCMTIEAPDGTTYVVGGFSGTSLPGCFNAASEEGNPWDFQGSQSDDDGTYESEHDGVFDPALEDEGDWTFTFVNDWDSTGASTMSWTDVTVTLHKTGGGGGTVCDDVTEVPWLIADPISGTTAPGASEEVTVTADSTAAGPGTHEAALCVATNDPAAPVVPVPVSLTVIEDGGEPILSFDPTALDFGDVPVGETSAPQTSTLSNTGDGDATGLAFSGLPEAGFEADTSACGDTLPAGGSCAVSVTFTPGAVGPATATLHAASDEGATADLALSGNGVGDGEPPIIDVDPDSLESTLPEGGAETQPLTIANLGDETLEWEVTQDGAAGVRAARPLGGSAAAAVGAAAVRTSRVVMVVSEDGVFAAPADLRWEKGTGKPSASRPVAGAAGFAHPLPLGATLWGYDDDAAIAEGVAIDDATVWGGWQLNGSRLSAHPIQGDGTPAFEFPAPDPGAWTGVAAAKGADRILFVERDFSAGNGHRVHAFTSQSDGTPDWSFELPTVPGALPNFRQVAVSYDGSTAATTFWDNTAEEATLYVFDAETGDVILSWTDPTFMSAVDLTDDGSIALVTQSSLATVLDTATGDILFQTAGSGAGGINYRISGDGSVLVVGGFDLDVYQFDGTTYQPVIQFTRAGSWFGQAVAVSRDGSTVGAFAGDFSTGWLTGEVFLFDVATGEMIGSHPVSGSGAFQGVPVDADSNDDGTVMAFASWGTEFQEWPEVMVFDRDVELIGEIDFPGSALSVDVTADGQFVAGGAKAVHANEFGNGGRIELIQVDVGAPGECLLPEWLSVDPASGTVPAGGEQVADVTFDATGLDPGTYTANLCLASNDPVTPLVVIPLTLTVEGGGEGPIADITPESFSFEVPQGGSDSDILNIGNIGDADLTWDIEEAETAIVVPEGEPYRYGLLGAPAFHAPVGFDRASGISRARGEAPADRVVLPAPQPAAIGSFSEGFDDITMLPGAGWALINNSEPVGPSSWFQGNETVFPSHEGEPDAYIAANYESTDDNGTISNWLLTPEVTIVNGTQLCFWTRKTPLFEEFLDRLEVRMSVEGDSTDVGDTAESVGVFTELLLTIEPDLELPNDYPEEWTQFCLTVRERPRQPTSGRFAFRYWVTDSGPDGTNGDYIGIDTVSVTQPDEVPPGGGCDDPVDIPWLAVDPASGTTPPGGSVPVTVAVDVAGLEPGEHTAQLCVTTNDPNASLVEVPVTLTVTTGPVASFEGLGDLPGGEENSWAIALSADGAVVGGASSSEGGFYEAIRWQDGVLEGLGDFPGGEFYSLAYGVSSDGSVLVGPSIAEQGSEAYRWAAGEMVGLGDLPGGSFYSEAFGVSGDGSVVIGGSESQNGTEAFRWQAGEMVGLGDFPEGGFNSWAYGVSADGSVVVGYGTYGTGEEGIEAFRWVAGDDALTGLGFLPGGSNTSVAWAVSPDGSVVVGQSSSANGYEAFRWTADGGMEGLGDLPGGPFFSYAQAVSGDGSVVVGYGFAGEDTRAFIWTPGEGTRDLKEVLEAVYGLDLTGWTLVSARRISDDGTVLVGEGIDPQGNSEGWRAVLGGSAVSD